MRILLFHHNLFVKSDILFGLETFFDFDYLKLLVSILLHDFRDSGPFLKLSFDISGHGSTFEARSIRILLRGSIEAAN